ncbi:MAG TPA: class I SAM-dependent methyltransferase [Rhabdochlamydiaceae bacterium]|nr:class I SAM-dependent methyltransferase [Rhabdochlamydiaceae bacterium]
MSSVEFKAAEKMPLIKLSCKKADFGLKKTEKNQLIKEIVQKIIKIALSVQPNFNRFFLVDKRPDASEFDLREVYRFSPKIDGQRLSFQWEWYCGDCTRVGVLRFQTGKSLCISDYCPDNAATAISTLIVGNRALCESNERIPSFLRALLNGNRFERLKIYKMPALSLDYFNQWDDQKKLYRELIYPKCINYMEKLIPPKATILELCSGDGEFAQVLFANKKIDQNIYRYFLVELNKISIEVAKKALQAQIANSRAYLFNGDIANVSYRKLLGKNKKVEFVLGIGALTEQVLPSKEIALEALKRAAWCLKVGGFMLFTGLTSSWLASEDFENLNLQVMNCTSPDIFRSSFRVDMECYLVQKLDPRKKINSLWPNFPSYTFSLRRPQSWFLGGH